MKFLPDMGLARSTAEHLRQAGNDARIVALSQAQQPSVITFRLEDMRAVRVNQFLQEIITRFAAELRQGALIRANEQGIRVRKLPAGK